MNRIFSILLMAWSVAAAGQTASFTRTIQDLYQAGSIHDSTLRKNAVLQQWAAVRAAGIPFVSEDSAAFFYRGQANSVAWMGDFNSWGYDKDFNNKGRRIPGTDIWVLRSAFPRDARLDYKVLVNETTWVIDPENPHQQWSGVGGGSPNSELRMPLWKQDAVLRERKNIPHGSVRKDILLTSAILGYQVNYHVYLPAGYEKLGKLPVLYVTDGNEYMMPELGNMITVLDNLIADKKIVPVLVVLIDHRDPINRSRNRRMEELNMNEQYLKFFTDELIPEVEGHYKVYPDAAHRAIMGTSMGGLTSAYFAFARPDLLSMAGIQSPAFWIRPQIYALCDSLKGTQVKVSLTTGLIHDAGEGAQKMKDILQKNSCPYHYRETNEGHSWGNWKNLIDDILIDFFGKQ